MAWDTDAIDMAINTIALVESGGAYDAINYRDPITVGAMQWFGTRAAGILDRIREEGTGWVTTGALASLNNELDTYGTSNPRWAERWLTGDEGKALKPILRQNHAVQNDQAIDDINGYKDAAVRLGMDPEGNTNAVIFYCIMYHQTPARANRIVNAAGAKSSIDRIYSFCMNDGTFGQYRIRYTTALNTIKSGTAPDIIDINDDDRPVPDGDGNNQTEPPAGNNGEQVQSLVEHIRVQGDLLVVRTRDGKDLFAYPTTMGQYMLTGTTEGRGEPPKNDPEDTGIPDPPPPTGDVSERQKTVRDWALAHLNTFTYTNDSRRVDIEASGAGDCSAFVRAAYSHVGVKLGLITSNQYTQGKRITSSLNFTESQLQVGDLIYIQWANPRWNSGKVTDHVEMYIGNDTLVGHPGPGKGGRTTALSTYRTLFRKVWIQRHIS